MSVTFWMTPIAACALFLLGGCATVPSKASVETVMIPVSGRAVVLSGGRRIPGSEIKSRFPGRTFQDGYRSFTWQFDSDGTYTWGGNGGDDGNWYSTGTWAVKDDTFCWTLEDYEMGCRALFEWKGLIRMSKPDGSLEPWALY